MSDLLITGYPWIKSLHVIAVISWMAGIFYLPRLFVHHVEQGSGKEEINAVFAMMEAKLFSVIMTPAMVASWLFGLVLVLTPGVVDWTAVWPWSKMLAVLGMTWFHMWCSNQRKRIASGINTYPGTYFRKMNEVPTLLMFLIVFSVIARPF